MRVVGIDPGLRITGYGIVEGAGNSFSLVEAGFVSTNKQDAMSERVRSIYDDVLSVIEEADAECVAGRHAPCVGAFDAVPLGAESVGAVDDGQHAAQGHALEASGPQLRMVLRDDSAVGDLDDTLLHTQQRVCRRDGLQVVLREHAPKLAAEGHIEVGAATAGVGQQDAAVAEVAAQGRHFLVGEHEVVVAGHVQDRMDEGVGLSQVHVRPFELHFHGRLGGHVLQQGHVA